MGVAIKGIDQKYANGLYYDGNIYSTIDDLAKAVNVPKKKLVEFLSMGWKVKDAVMSAQNNTVVGTTPLEDWEIDCMKPGTYTFDPICIKTLAGRCGVTPVKFLELTRRFFSDKGIKAPKKIKAFPLVIYNNKWYYTYQELCNACGIDVEAYQQFQVSKAIWGSYNKTPLTAVKALSEEERTYILYNGKVTWYVDLLKEIPNAKDIDSLLESGEAVKIRAKKYMDCTYTQKSLCMDFQIIFGAYLKRRGVQNPFKMEV